MNDLQTYLNIAVAIVILAGVVFTAGTLRASLRHLTEDVEEIKADVKLVVDISRRVSVIEERVTTLQNEQLRMRDKIHEHSNELQKLTLEKV